VGSCGSLWLGDMSGLSGWRLSQGEVLGGYITSSSVCITVSYETKSFLI
jgi:hypothetical protein